MNELQSDLWQRISQFSIDGAEVPLPFRKRLARENGWSVSYADRVVEEYKRFLFLCCEAGHVCTPSEDVDEAWHLHLVYTRSYWERLCPEVLGKPLHHDPTSGGEAQDAKFDDCYSKTRESYQRFFGEPPQDIWPSNEIRFRQAAPVAKAGHQKLKFAGALAIAATLGGCVASATGASNVAQGLGTVLLILLVFVVVILVVSQLSTRYANRRGDGSGSSSGCGSGCSSHSHSDSSGNDSSGCGSGCGGGCGGGD